jgi:hypothetical protein
MNLTLEDDVLETPDGRIPLSQITRAEVIRHREDPAAVGDGDKPGGYSGHAGGIGGALIGGAVAGPAGFVGGALLGSALDDQDSDPAGPARTTSATMVFESPAVSSTTEVDHIHASDAEKFVAAVQEAKTAQR